MAVDCRSARDEPVPNDTKARRGSRPRRALRAGRPSYARRADAWRMWRPAGRAPAKNSLRYVAGMRRPALAVSLLLAAAGCRDAPSASAGALVVTPDVVRCTAGDRVELAATAGDRAAPATFTVAGDGA